MDNTDVERESLETAPVVPKIRRMLSKRNVCIGFIAAAMLVASFSLGYAARVPHDARTVAASAPVCADMPIFENSLSSWLMPPWQIDSVDRLFADAPKITAQNLSKEVVVTAANLPPISAKDVKVKVEGRSLTIDAERDRDAIAKSGKNSQENSSMVSFHATVPLPPDVNRDKVQTNFKDGVLTICIPKS